LTIKAFIILQKISTSNKNCSELSVHQRIKNVSVKTIKQHNFVKHW